MTFMTITTTLDNVKPPDYAAGMPKARMVNVRVPDDEYPRWVEAADVEKRTITSLVRRAVDVYLAEMRARGELPKDTN